MTPAATITEATMTETAPVTARTALALLRSLTPHCRTGFADAKHLAERHATHLVRLLDPAGEGIGIEQIAAQPRIRVVYDDLPTSGLSYWNGQDWIIAINQSDSLPRQRFTALHEYKHIIDHPHAARLYHSSWEAERAADYFAACALMPKPELKRVFCTITQRIEELATYFGVSQQAIRVRLEQTKLVDPAPVTGSARCARPIRTPLGRAQQFVPTSPRAFTVKGANA